MGGGKAFQADRPNSFRLNDHLQVKKQRIVLLPSLSLAHFSMNMRIPLDLKKEELLGFPLTNETMAYDYNP